MTSKSWNFASEKENVANPIEEAVISKINHVKLWLNTISCKDSTLQGLCQCCSESCSLHEPELCMEFDDLQTDKIVHGKIVAS